jgi:hypothetical protein
LTPFETRIYRAAAGQVNVSQKDFAVRGSRADVSFAIVASHTTKRESGRQKIKVKRFTTSEKACCFWMRPAFSLPRAGNRILGRCGD